MLKKIFLWSAVVLVGVLAYLLFWPVPIAPVAWTAPTNAGYVGKFELNMKLTGLKSLPIGNNHGPEDVAGRFESDRMMIYTSTQRW